MSRNSPWKLLPLAFMFALGVFALLPGGSNNPVKPGVAEAAFDCTTTHRIRVNIRNDDTGANLTVGGSRVRISPDPQNATAGGNRTYVDNGSNDDNSAAGVIDELDACSATDASTYTLLLLDVPQGCKIVGSDIETLQNVTANRQVTFHVEDCGLTPTPTATTTATVTPTATSTPAAPSQATVSAAPTSLNCSGSSFITAVFRDAGGNPVPNGTQVTVTANIGSVSPSTASTNGGSVLVLYTAPATSGGTATITATAGGVSGTTTITVNCAQATNTPVPPPPTSTPSGGGVIVPPATGDGGLAAGNPLRLYGGIVLIALSLLGTLAVLRPRRA